MQSSSKRNIIFLSDRRGDGQRPRLDTISGNGRGPSASVCILRRFSSRRTSSNGGNSQKPRRPSRRAKAPERFFRFRSSLFRQAVFYYCIVSHARTHAREENRLRRREPRSTSARRTDAAPAEMIAAHLVNAKSSGPREARILPGDQLQRAIP